MWQLSKNLDEFLCFFITLVYEFTSICRKTSTSWNSEILCAKRCQSRSSCVYQAKSNSSRHIYYLQEESTVICENYALLLKTLKGDSYKRRPIYPSRKCSSTKVMQVWINAYALWLNSMNEVMNCPPFSIFSPMAISWLQTKKKNSGIKTFEPNESIISSLRPNYRLNARLGNAKGLHISSSPSFLKSLQYIWPWSTVGVCT